MLRSAIAAILAMTVAMTLTNGAQATTLGLTTEPDPAIVAAGDVAFIPGLIDFTFTSLTGTSSAPAAASDLVVGLTVDIDGAGALGPTGGVLNVFDVGGLFLAGTASAVGFEIDSAGPDTIEFLFDDTSGAAADAFGPSVLAIASGEFGVSPDGSFVTEGFFATTSLEIRGLADTGGGIPMPMPAPASLPILLLGLATLAVGARRRRR